MIIIGDLIKKQSRPPLGPLFLSSRFIRVKECSMLFRRTGLATVIAAMSAALPAVADEYAGFPADDAEVIVVTAAGFEQQLRDSPASISLLTHIDLPRRRHTNIAEALADIPG